MASALPFRPTMRCPFFLAECRAAWWSRRRVRKWLLRRVSMSLILQTVGVALALLACPASSFVREAAKSVQNPFT